MSKKKRTRFPWGGLGYGPVGLFGIDQVSHDALRLKAHKSHWFSSCKKWSQGDLQTENSHSSKYFQG